MDRFFGEEFTGCRVESDGPLSAGRSGSPLLLVGFIPFELVGECARSDAQLLRGSRLVSLVSLQGLQDQPSLRFFQGHGRFVFQRARGEPQVIDRQLVRVIDDAGPLNPRCEAALRSPANHSRQSSHGVGMD